METTKFEDIKSLNVTDKQLKEFSDRCQELYEHEREVYDRANEVVIQIGYGGLWRGREATLLIIADCIKN